MVVVAEVVVAEAVVGRTGARSLMEHGHNTMKRNRINSFYRALLMVLAMAAPVAQAADPVPAASARPTYVQNTYASPEEAAKALADAMRTDERKLIWRVLGPGASKFVRSGDPVQDEEAREAFVAAYDKSVKFEHTSDTKATLLVGPGDFPFPYPLVMQNGRWQFDARQGNEQVLDRRIGRNELAAIKVCLAYVDAQREYANRDRDGNGLLEYAQKLTSTPGMRDGLYWETKAGEPPSPLGPADGQRARPGSRSTRPGQPLPRLLLQDPDGAGQGRARRRL